MAACSAGGGGGATASGVTEGVLLALAATSSAQSVEL